MKDPLSEFQLAINAPPVPDWFHLDKESEPEYPEPVGLDPWLFRDVKWPTKRQAQEYYDRQAAEAAWKNERARRRLARWPWEYARMVLEARPS